MTDIDQYNLAQRMVTETNINIVTCGECGIVMLHELSDNDVKCPICGYESEPCDFPDYFHL